MTAPSAPGPGSVLAIETATSLVGAAFLDAPLASGRSGADVVRTEGEVVERSSVAGRLHAEQLGPAIAEVCSAAGGLQAVQVVAVDVGPGLFTGLRVGVATAKALGQALGIGVLGVRSIDVLAASARDWLSSVERPWPAVVVAIDARRGEVFTATFRFGASGVGVPGHVEDPESACVERVHRLEPDDWARTVIEERRRSGGRVVLVGDGAVRYLDVLAPADRRSGVAMVKDASGEPVGAPSPAVLARLAYRRLVAGARALEPVQVVPEYGREPDAQVNWTQRIAPGARDPAGVTARPVATGTAATEGTARDP